MIQHIFHWFLTVTGTHITNGVYSSAYNFWSGFAGDLFIFGGVVHLIRKHNCHVKGCPRVGMHPVNGTPYIVCKLHHPDVPNEDITYDHIVKHKKVI